MTWKAFIEAVEAKGVTGSTRIAWISVQDVHLEVRKLGDEVVIS